jgi:hypothetical protein
MTDGALFPYGGMAIPTHTKPRAVAPVVGVYQQLSVFGTPTGRWKSAREGEQLPPGPLMFSWRLMWPSKTAPAAEP